MIKPIFNILIIIILLLKVKELSSDRFTFIN